MFKRYLASFSHAIRGILFAIKNDFGFRKQFYGISLILLAASYFFTPLTSTELLFIGLAYILILITELQNSALEIALDTLHAYHHESIGRSKDMTAGAVFIAGLFLVLVLVVLTITRL